MRYSFKNKDRSLPLYVDSIGYMWHQESVNRPNGYPYIHWLQTYSGSGIVTIENKKIILKPGTGILINQAIPHKYSPIEAQEWQTGYFTFGGSLVSEITTVLGFNDYLAIEKPEDRLINFIKHYYSDFEQNSVDPYFSSSLVYDFLLLIKKYSVKNPNNYQLDTHIIQPILNLIYANYSEQLTNSDFTRITNYSLQYILEIFRYNQGMSPQQILRDHRILKSKELLLNHPELSIEEISQLVGFNTNSYFIAQFKKVERVTPGKFRKFYQ